MYYSLLEVLILTHFKILFTFKGRMSDTSLSIIAVQTIAVIMATSIRWAYLIRISIRNIGTSKSLLSSHKTLLKNKNIISHISNEDENISHRVLTAFSADQTYTNLVALNKTPSR